ncbi:hypothetical protein HK101_009382 [Irineochytrium annulatum]|nr:hypothetical protein HK101_009382 [Irineochytrium annulatum]
MAVMDAVCTTEAELNIALDSLPAPCHDLQGLEADSIAIPPMPELPRAKLDAWMQVLTGAMRTSSGDGAWKAQATVMMARLELAAGDAAACVARLKNLPVTPASVDSAAGEYAKIVAVMQHTILGMACQMTDDKRSAYESFSAAVTAFQTVPYTTPAPPKIITARQDLDQWLVWGHDAYFGLAVTAMQLGEDASAVEVTRHARVQECYDWWVVVEAQASMEEGVADALERHVRLIETVYRGTRHTFQSLKLLRYLSHAFLSLLLRSKDSISSVEKGEALLVIGSYVDRFEKRLAEAEELVRKRAASRRVSSVSATGGKPAVAVTPVGVDGTRVTEELQMEGQGPGVVVGDVEGETMADAIAVCVTGTRLCILNPEGDVELLRTGVRYAELAMKFFRDHGSSINGADVRNLILQKATQNLGLAYGELALEVPLSEERAKLQGLAVQALRDARPLSVGGAAAENGDVDGEEGEDDGESGAWDVEYQLALQLAEVGEIPEAINILNQSILHNPAHGPAWNLLSLLLTSRKDYSKALEVCDVGWKEIVSGCIRPAGSDAANSEEEIQFSWESVDTEVKEELINLKLTQLMIEVQKLGARAALESLHSLFVLFRKLFGSLTSAVDAEGMSQGAGGGRASMDVGTDGRLTPVHGGTGGRPHSRGSTGGSSVYPNGNAVVVLNGSLAILPLFSFRAHDMQISLWLTASALYRQLGRFDDARSAVEQAEKLAETLAKLDLRIKERGSRIFKAEKVGTPVIQGGATTLRKGRGLKKYPTLPPSSSQKEGRAKWGPVDKNVRRVLADIQFEVNKLQSCMIKDAQYRQSKTPVPVSRWAKYLPPSGKISGSALVGTMNSSALGGAGGLIARSSRRPSIVSISRSIQSVSLGPGTASPMLRAGETLTAGDGSNNGGSSGSVSNLSRPPGMPGGAASTASSSATPALSSATSSITLVQLIQDFMIVSALDDFHLPTRVHLATLHLENGDEAAAEFWFERACKRTRARGCDGGRPGVAMLYGGVTGHWGWESWAGLGRLLKKTGRLPQQYRPPQFCRHTI